MKIGMVGIGDIAKKAYLPTLNVIPGLDIHLATRNQQVLTEVSAQYRIPHTYLDAGELIGAGVQAVFIHSATIAHEALVRKFLTNGIHVFVDKPLTNHYQTSEALVALAEERGLVLRVGFNRRFAPAYQRLKSNPQPDVILMQKNRQRHPDEIRRVVMDDFIHVVDTLRFLLPGDTDDLVVSSRTKDGLLQYVLVELRSGQSTAIGVMHRNSGLNEEQLEVIAEGDKWSVRNLVHTRRFQEVASTIPTSDWTPTLVHRGFPMMVEAFLSEVQAADAHRDRSRQPKTPGQHDQGIRDALATHQVCEEIIRRIELPS